MKFIFQCKSCKQLFLDGPAVQREKQINEILEEYPVLKCPNCGEDARIWLRKTEYQLPSSQLPPQSHGTRLHKDNSSIGNRV
jgi:RNase P subunit RPR2